MEFAPLTVQNIPDCLQREPMMVLQPASNDAGADEQVLSAELRIAHPFCVLFEVVGFVTDLFEQFGCVKSFV